MTVIIVTHVATSVGWHTMWFRSSSNHLCVGSHYWI